MDAAKGGNQVFFDNLFLSKMICFFHCNMRHCYTAFISDWLQTLAHPLYTPAVVLRATRNKYAGSPQRNDQWLIICFFSASGWWFSSMNHPCTSATICGRILLFNFGKWTNSETTSTICCNSVVVWWLMSSDRLFMFRSLSYAGSDLTGLWSSHSSIAGQNDAASSSGRRHDKCFKLE